MSADKYPSTYFDVVQVWWGKWFSDIPVISVKTRKVEFIWRYSFFFEKFPLGRTILFVVTTNRIVLHESFFLNDHCARQNRSIARGSCKYRRHIPSTVHAWVLVFWWYCTRCTRQKWLCTRWVLSYSADWSRSSTFLVGGVRSEICRSIWPCASPVLRYEVAFHSPAHYLENSVRNFWLNGTRPKSDLFILTSN